MMFTLRIVALIQELDKALQSFTLMLEDVLNFVMLIINK